MRQRGVTVHVGRGVRTVAEMSVDDGRTGRPLRATVPAGPVALRVTATDRDGNFVTRTVIRAFG